MGTEGGGDKHVLMGGWGFPEFSVKGEVIGGAKSLCVVIA